MPLLADIKRQGAQWKRFLPRLALFLLVFFVLDRLLGAALLEGLERYYGLDEPAQVLLIGHSHTVLGVDKVLLEDLTGKRVAKYARQGANAADRLAMLRQYLERYGDAVETVVYDVNAYSFTGSGLSENSYRLFFPFMDEPVVAAHIEASGPGWGEVLLRHVVRTTRFNEVTLGLAARGWLGKWDNLKSGTVDIDRLKKQVEEGQIKEIKFDEPEIRVFEEALRETRAHEKPLVLTFYPTVDVYNSAHPAQFAEAYRRLDAYGNCTKGVCFLDLLAAFQSRYELFYDSIHMNPAGQREVTRALAEWLNAQN